MNTLHLDEPARVEEADLYDEPPRPPRLTITPTQKDGRTWRSVLVAVVVIYVITSSYLIFNTRTQLSAVKAAQAVSIEKLSQGQAVLEQRLEASNEAMAQQLGTTRQQLHARMQERATELQHQQQALAKRLEEQQSEQAAQKQQIGHVSGDVASVHTELGSAKMDIAATRADLESTKVKLDRAIGDLTGQSSLIARTRDELEELKHRGDRIYYEFSLSKGARPTPVSTVSLQLKKVNPKKNKFTLNVIADDRTIEKKDRGAAEPLQFYTGHDRLLYEIVIFTVEKNDVTGYLSTPKSAARPIS
jgi:hypothetical protein